jgi:hypothetical protein
MPTTSVIRSKKSDITVDLLMVLLFSRSPPPEGWREGGVLRRFHAVAQRRGGFQDQQPTPGCRLRPQNPPEVPPCPRGDAVFIERDAA